VNRQAIVGLFTVLGLLGLFVIFFVLSNVSTNGRYKIGVHFKSASGIHAGALVYESGVNVGVVDSIQLLPADFTVSIILAINNNVDIPRDARFIIQAPLTGDASLEIVPKAPVPRAAGLAAPTPAPGAVAVLPREVLPLDQQPQGTNPATLTDLLEQGQGEVTRLDTLLADLEQREPQLLNTLQSALTNANELSITTNQEVQKLARTLDALQGPLGNTLASTTARIVDLTTRLDDLAKSASPQVNELLTSFNASAVSLNDTVTELHGFAKNPQLRANLIDTTRYLAQTSQTIALLVGDLRNVTGNAQTQAQLRDTVANIDATTQRANSLLGQLGGASDVYGVDARATPAAVPSPRAPNAAGAPPTPLPETVGSPLPDSTAIPPAGAVTPLPGTTLTPVPGSTPPATLPARLRARLASLASNLIAIQIRVNELSLQNAGTFSSPLLTQDRGPQTDFNVVALPKGRTSLLTGANDIGSNGTTSYNFAGLQTLGPGDNFRVGGGVLYSRLGALAQYGGRTGLGVETRVYDLRHPTVDGYATLHATPDIELFGGERDILHSGRRTVLGLQLQF
jgi:ABC-type transporter Mla subunit MlaD